MGAYHTHARTQAGVADQNDVTVPQCTLQCCLMVDLSIFGMLLSHSHR